MQMEEGLNIIKPQNLTDVEVQEEEKEPNLFDIPNEDASEIEEYNTIDEEQVTDNDEENDQE